MAKILNGSLSASINELPSFFIGNAVCFLAKYSGTNFITSGLMYNLLIFTRANPMLRANISVISLSEMKPSSMITSSNLLSLLICISLAFSRSVRVIYFSSNKYCSRFFIINTSTLPAHAIYNSTIQQLF